MSWTCARPGCATTVETDEQKVCPACGEEKTSWTLRSDQTRTMTVALPRARLECRRGHAQATRPGSTRALGIAWRATKEVSSLPKAEARRLAAKGELPAPRDVLDVRVAPPPGDPTWTLSVGVAFEELPLAERTFELERRAESLDEAGRLSLRFVCVHGPGGLEGVAFPRLQVLDVSEDTPLGHAPALELSGVRVNVPISLKLVTAEAPPAGVESGAKPESGAPGFAPVSLDHVLAHEAARPRVHGASDLARVSNTKSELPDDSRPWVKDFLYATENLLIADEQTYHKACTGALLDLYATPTGKDLLHALRKTMPRKVRIEPPDDSKASMPNRVDPTDKAVYSTVSAERQADGRWKVFAVTGWDTTVRWHAHRVQLGDKDTLDWRRVPAALLLGHELIHAWHAALGMQVQDSAVTEDPGDPKVLVKVEELLTVGLVRPSEGVAFTENMLRREWYDANPLDLMSGPYGTALEDGRQTVPRRPKYSAL